MSSSTSSPPSNPTIRRLQQLRLLPPPCNELVPLLLTIFVFIMTKFIIGHDTLQYYWSDRIDHWLQQLRQQHPPTSYLFLSLWNHPIDNDDYYRMEYIFMMGTYSIYMAVYWGYSLMMYILTNVYHDSFFQYFRIQTDETTIHSYHDLFRMIPIVLFNQVVIGIPMLKVYYWIWTTRIGWFDNTGDDVTLMIERISAIPSILKFIIMMFLHVLCTECWFYTIHRMLHNTKYGIYQNIHYIHHKYTAPSCLESVYVHPIEFIINSYTVLFMGPLISGASLYVFWIWIGLCTFLQLHDHCGYWIPFLPRVLMHDYHHQKYNCCYGIIGLLDAVLVTEGNLAMFIKEHETRCCDDNTKKE